MSDLENTMTMEAHERDDEDDEPLFGEMSLKIADTDGREWYVSMPYPTDIEVGEAHERLRGALDVLLGGALDG